MRSLPALFFLTAGAVIGPAMSATTSRPCTGAQVMLTRDWITPRGTGVSAAMVQLTNRSPTTCLLASPPALMLLDRDGPIPFVVRYHPAKARSPILLRPGKSVYVGFDSYRCDVRIVRLATAARITVGRRALVVRLPGSRPAIAWCGRGDPGSYLNVSAYEPTVALAAKRA